MVDLVRVRICEVASTLALCAASFDPPVRARTLGESDPPRQIALEPIARERGYVVAGFVDCDGDGAPDYLVADPGDSAGELASGATRMVSGATGDRIWSFESEERGEGLGSYVELVGDVDADGAPDFLVQGCVRGGVGRGRVLSGRSGALLYSWSGAAFGAAGDLDRDGHADLLVGSSPAASSERDDGHYRVLSGEDGEVLLEFRSVAAGGNVFQRAGSLGDVNGDGLPELLIRGRNCIHVHSGADGALIRIFESDEQSRILTAAGGADFDRDGVGDVLLLRAGSSGRFVEARSGRDGGRIFRTAGHGSRSTCRGLFLPGDLDGDRYPDFVTIGDQEFGKSSATRAYSGADGALLYEIGALSDEWCSWSLHVGKAGDVDGDGLPDLLVGQVPSIEEAAPRWSKVFTVSGRTGHYLGLLLQSY